MEEFYTEAIPDPIAVEESHTGVLRFFIDILETLILSLLLFLAINAVSARIKVDGFSMEPTLQNGEFIIVNKMAYEWGEYTRGDIVVFHFPKNPKQEYIKRVIGLPGDEITIRNGQVTVNGTTLDEEYIMAPPSYAGSWTVPDHSLFVLGDNRNNSSDSHNWGWVDKDLVVGRAVFVYWPPSDWGLIEHPNLAHAAP